MSEFHHLDWRGLLPSGTPGRWFRCAGLAFLPVEQPPSGLDRLYVANKGSVRIYKRSGGHWYCQMWVPPAKHTIDAGPFSTLTDAAQPGAAVRWWHAQQCAAAVVVVDGRRYDAQTLKPL